MNKIIVLLFAAVFTVNCIGVGSVAGTYRITYCKWYDANNRDVTDSDELTEVLGQLIVIEEFDNAITFNSSSTSTERNAAAIKVGDKRYKYVGGNSNDMVIFEFSNNQLSLTMSNNGYHGTIKAQKQ